jgi:hypothetical protein
MATKSALITSINTFITAVINPTKHRNSMLDLVNELFQTTTTQVINTGLNIFYCNLRYKKIGNIIYIDGTIQSAYSTVQSGVVLVTIPNAIFYSKTGQDTVVVCQTNGDSCLVSFATNSIALLSPLTPYQTIYINAHYQTND